MSAQTTLLTQSRVAPTGKAPVIINPQITLEAPPKDLVLTRQSDGDYAYQIRYFSCLAPGCTARLQNPELLWKHCEEQHTPGHPSYLLTTQEAIKARRIEIEARIKISNTELRREGKHPDQVNKGRKELGAFVQYGRFEGEAPDTITKEKRVGVVESQTKKTTQNRAVVDLTSPESKKANGTERMEVVKPEKRMVEIQSRARSQEHAVVDLTSSEPKAPKETGRNVVKAAERKVAIDLLADSEEEESVFLQKRTRAGLDIPPLKPSKKDSVESVASTGSCMKRHLGHDSLEVNTPKRVKTDRG